MIRRAFAWAAASLCWTAISPAAQAQEPVRQQVFVSEDGRFSVEAGVGYTWLTANELVYEDDQTISRLIWTAQAPVVTGGLRFEFFENWLFKANGTFGFNGASSMRDYDWLAPYATGSGPDDWSHYSNHQDTSLDRYIDIDVSVGRRFTLNDAINATVEGGFKYTQAKWLAMSGYHIYSDQGFRDDIYEAVPGQKSIGYEQRYAGLFLGTELTYSLDAWTLSALLRGGATFSAEDTDYHFRRGLRFDDDIGVLPFIVLGGRVDYAFNAQSGLFFDASLTKYFRRTGDAAMMDMETGALLAQFEDGSGMDFQSVTLSAGLRLAF